MQDPLSVIAQATAGIGEDLAKEYEITPTRMYEILGKDNPYPKIKRLIRAIARRRLNSIRLIKADLDALFAELLGASEGVTQAKLNEALFTAIQAKTNNASRPERLQANRIAIAFLQSDIAEIEESINKEAVERAEREYFQQTFRQQAIDRQTN